MGHARTTVWLQQCPRRTTTRALSSTLTTWTLGPCTCHPGCACDDVRDSPLSCPSCRQNSAFYNQFNMTGTHAPQPAGECCACERASVHGYAHALWWVTTCNAPLPHGPYAACYLTRRLLELDRCEGPGTGVRVQPTLLRHQHDQMAQQAQRRQPAHRQRAPNGAAGGAGDRNDHEGEQAVAGEHLPPGGQHLVQLRSPPRCRVRIPLAPGCRCLLLL